MPRRPRKSPAGPKSAKGAGNRGGDKKGGNGSIKKWKSKSDVIPFLDDEDSFHAARDAEGDSIGGEDEESEEEEVFALDVLSDEDEEDKQDEEEDDDVPTPLPKAKTAKTKSKQPSPPPSDRNSDSESEEEGWGSKKSTYYSTNHTRDEEDFELEAAEALRIQRKAAEAVDESRGDFGLPSSTDAILDSASVALPGDETKEEEATETKEVVDSESIALARDWSDTVQSMTILEAKLSNMDAKDPGTPMMHLYHQTMLTYTTTLAFYFYTRSSPSPPPASFKNQILERLLTLKRSLSTLEELDLESSLSGGSADEDEEEEDWELDLGEEDDIEEIAKKLGLTVEEAKEMYDQAPLSEGSGSNSGEEQEEEEAEEALLPPPPPPLKKKSKKSKAPVFDLVEPTFNSSASSSSSNSSRPSKHQSGDAYGENTELSSADTTDKKSRKKELRFYTSRIESQSKRRAAVAQERRDGGGDDDLPYTTRTNTKKVQQRKHEKPDVLDGEEHGQGEGKKRKRMNEEEDGEGEGEGEDGYYELISKKAKAAKKQKADGYVSIHEPTPLTTSTSSGPRNLTSAILNNRGLTPNRPKNIRNPRVKKRMRFEAAKKKVGSQKAVYKGGLKESKGVYGGEKSGISRVVKSVKLG